MRSAKVTANAFNTGIHHMVHRACPVRPSCLPGALGFQTAGDQVQGLEHGLLGRYTTWVGPVFTRVPSKALEDPKALRVYAADEDVVFASDREDVHEVAHDLWRSEHAFGADALGEVEAAAQAAAAAKAARCRGRDRHSVGRDVGHDRPCRGHGPTVRPGPRGSVHRRRIKRPMSGTG